MFNSTLLSDYVQTAILFLQDLLEEIAKHNQYEKNQLRLRMNKSKPQEVETRFREMFRKIKNVPTEPSKIEDVIGGLLSGNGAYRCCDDESKDGKNFCVGFDKLVRGFIIAYRNPLSHINHVLAKQDAFEIITLSGNIMNTLDNGCGWIEGDSE